LPTGSLKGTMHRHHLLASTALFDGLAALGAGPPAAVHAQAARSAPFPAGAGHLVESATLRS